MPIYPYACACGQRFDKVDAMTGTHLAATCTCGQMANRVWTTPYAAVDNTPAHYNYGLGVRVSSKADIREAKRRYTGETGSNLIEIGNETKWRAKRVRYEYPTAAELGIAV